MPKGVEHASSESTNNLVSRVKTAVMPKGVEHFNLLMDLPWIVVVKTAVMPKGVEHRDEAERLDRRIAGENSSDAERR